nr:MAG TPA: hypothetical protein [Caudoviricetes sp.]
MDVNRLNEVYRTGGVKNHPTMSVPPPSSSPRPRPWKTKIKNGKW